MTKHNIQAYLSLHAVLFKHVNTTILTYSKNSNGNDFLSDIQWTLIGKLKSYWSSSIIESIIICNAIVQYPKAF